MSAADDSAAPAAAAPSKKQQHRKDKPWDHEGIDHWRVEPFRPEDSSGPFLEESSFATLFPKYREQYLRESWPQVTRALESSGVACELNLIEGSMTVRTTRKTWDPYAIIKARDMIRLLARSVPLQQAVKIMQDDTSCDIIKIGNTVSNRERFVKRRQRLVGANGATLKALELLTGCYICVQGNTVASMGSFKGLKLVRRIVLDCMKNIHPVYHVKELMIKRELEKDPQLKNENWDRFLPHFKKRNLVKKSKRAIVKKQPYTPFPPPQQPSKIDLQIESGEYFLSEEGKQARKKQLQLESQQRKADTRKSARQKDYVAPAEPAPRSSAAAAAPPAADDTHELAEKLKRKSKASGAKGSAAALEDFVALEDSKKRVAASSADGASSSRAKRRAAHS